MNKAEVERYDADKYEMRTQVGANIKSSLWKQAKENNIGWTSALEFGVKFKLAEMGLVDDYPANNLSKKIEKMTGMLQEKCEELEKLPLKINIPIQYPTPEPEMKTIEQDMDEVFGGKTKDEIQ